MGDPLAPLFGTGLIPVVSYTSGASVSPSGTWVYTGILGTPLLNLIGFTTAPLGPQPPPAGTGDISFFVKESGASGWVERTDWLVYPLKRSSNLSRGQLTVTISNAGKANGAVWRPSQFDECILYIGTYLWFRGQYWFGTEIRLGSTPYYQLTGTCLTYEARMDRLMIHSYIDFVWQVGAFLDAFIINPMNTYFNLGMTTNIHPYDIDQPYILNRPTIWDLVSFTQAIKTTILDQFTLMSYLDANMVLQFFNPDNSGIFGLSFGTGPAPFDVVDVTENSAEPLWQNLTVTRGDTNYTNRSYARSNQTLKSNQTLFDNRGLPFDNPFLLSYVPFSEDAAAVAAVGPVESVQTSKNNNLGQLDSISDSGTIAYEVRQIELDTFQIGVEPGQRIVVNTTLPLLDDTLIVSGVESDLVGPFPSALPVSIAGSGPLRFSHKVKADNANLHARQSGIVFWQSLINSVQAPVPKTAYAPSWDLAPSAPGAANDGMTIGTWGSDIPAIRDGIMQQASLTFRNPPLTTDVIMDILQNGVSIFPTSPSPGITFPVGGTAAVVTFKFTSDPLNVKGPSTEGTSTGADLFRAVCLQGDADANNGQLAITVLG